jgi:hypothetical protein
MTTKEAKNLLVGTVVMWDENTDDTGTVRQISSSAVYIDWVNGDQGWIDFKDMKHVSIR